MKKLSIALLVAAVAMGLMVGGAAGKSAKTTAGTQVCVLLPDTTTSVRWEQFDKPAFIAAFKKAGLTAAVVNALGQQQKQLAQAEQCINDGAKVGIITSLDTGTSIAIQKKFAAAGGKSIDYDRQIVGGIGAVYISFDGNAVGRIQARGVISGMVAKKTYGPKGVIAELWGGPTDANAFWFKSGNDDVLNPLFKVKKVTKGPAKFVPNWDATSAQTIFEQMLVQTNNNIQGVVAANDGIAGAVVATLKAKGLKPIPLSGQDATVQGVQNIISGWQTNTVYKYVPDEANAAAAAAVALFKGKAPKTNSTRPNGSKKQPTLVIPVVSITKANYTRLFTDKFLKRSDVCSGAVQAVLQVDRRPRWRHLRVPPRSFRSRTMSDTPLLEIRGLSKTFGSVQALTEVDFEVRKGEVMALVGDNGAGKSTLIKCIAGIHGYDEGEIVFDGEPVTIHSPKDAARLGIEVVYQDLALCDNLDVVQNMFLGREERDWLYRLKEPVMEQRTVETLRSLAVTTISSIRQPVASLSGGQRQSVAVAKAVQWNSRLVILDEPTAALGVAQTRQVLDLVKRLAEQGLAVVLVSHNLHDIFEVATRITVLRLGRDVGVYEREATTQQEVVTAITAGIPTKVAGIAETAGDTL